MSADEELNAEEKLKDKLLRLRIIKTWRKRLKTIEKKLGKSQRAFFRDHKITQSHISKMINSGSIAKWPTVRRVEAALSKDEAIIQKRHKAPVKKQRG